MRRLAISFLVTLLSLSTAVAQDAPIVIRAGTLIDGKGGVSRNVTIVVEGNRIRSVGTSNQRAQYDFSNLTVMPGLIDTHVHIDTHFGRDGKAGGRGETPQQTMLYGAENLYSMLMNGFTATQSIGGRLDSDLRDAINRGILPGPRLFTSIQSVNENTGAPQQIREFVRKVVASGADLVKIFASKSIREGGAQTLSDEQIKAACDEAKALGKRSWVHAHADSAVRAATVAGCFAVTHGSQVSDQTLQLMAERGTFFEPNIGLVSQNYIENKDRYFGTGNFDEAGFKFMEDGIPLKLSMFKRTLKIKGVKLIMGTDAGAGAHGQNAREITYRVQVGGQAPMDAIAAATSLNAEALGLKDRIGTLAPSFDADIIAIDGDPLKDITALRRVVFVMRGGKVYKNIALSPRSVQ
ncbi:MAG: amidohydrolase family protein [Acidobacteria bacterium]|nr:amidohydrolase family protein [Acidobacteriota bacterium]